MKPEETKPEEMKPEESAPPEKKPAETKSAEMEKVKLADVVRELAKEGREEFRTLKQWPRREADYAIKKNVQADSAEVVAMLGRKLDRNPALDGYIKWQLLSFSPDYAAVPKAYDLLVRGLPDLTPRAQPNPQQMRIFSAFEDKGNERMIDKLRKTIGDYEMTVADSDTANMPAIAYRDAIIREIPEDNGTRMLVMMQDIEDRFMAGHMSHVEAMKDLVADARRRKDDATLSRAVRQRLIAEAERLNSLKTPLIRGITLTAGGQVTINPFKSVYAHKQLAQLKAYLDGKEPE
jgi:hypothetical protein